MNDPENPTKNVVLYEYQIGLWFRLANVKA